MPTEPVCRECINEPGRPGKADLRFGSFASDGPSLTHSKNDCCPHYDLPPVISIPAAPPLDRGAGAGSERTESVGSAGGLESAIGFGSPGEAPRYPGENVRLLADPPCVGCGTADGKGVQKPNLSILWRLSNTRQFCC
jgi:hypothetical protein